MPFVIDPQTGKTMFIPDRPLMPDYGVRQPQMPPQMMPQAPPQAPQAPPQGQPLMAAPQVFQMPEIQMSEADKQQALKMALFNAGANIMSNMGPSRMPVSGAQILGQAGQAGMQGYQQSKAEAMERFKTLSNIQSKQKLAEMGGNLSDTRLYSMMMHSDDPEQKAMAEQMLTYRRAQAPEAYSTTLAKRRAEVGTTAEKERQTVIGRGEITPIQKKYNAQSKVSDVLGSIKEHYEKLGEMGSIVDIEKDAVSNISARAESSGIGQNIGKAVGSEAQSLRNKINQIRPLLINHIRQASEMGARGLDSEKELEFYLQAATDPALDIQTNFEAIQVLDKAYGLGGLGLEGTPAPVGAPSVVPPKTKKSRYSKWGIVE